MYYLVRTEGTAVEAQSLSTMAGILSALMFASIIFIMSNPPKDRNTKEYEPYVFSLFNSFFLLLFATFLYIPVSGSRFWPEQEIAFLLAGFVLAIAMCQLFFGMPWIFKSYNFSNSIIIGTKIIFRSIVILAIMNAIGTMYNVYNNIERFFSVDTKIINDSSMIWTLIALLMLPFLGMMVHYLCFRNENEKYFKSISMAISFLSILFSLSVGCYFVYVFTGWSYDFAPDMIEDFILRDLDKTLPKPIYFEYLRHYLTLSLAGFLFLYELGLPRTRN